jgi:lipopolysaccharide transport system permease protein
MTTVAAEPTKPPAPEPAAPPERPRTLRLEAHKGWQPIDLKELWHYRDLIWFMSLRGVTARHKQSLLGFLWQPIRLLFQMVIFTVIFGQVARLPSDGVPYPIFSYSALLIWGLFAVVIERTANSIVGSKDLITKVYFPRLVIPISAAMVALVDTAIALVILVGMMFWYQVYPSWQIALFPLFVAQSIIVALAFGLLIASINVRIRDAAAALGIVMQVWLYATPVAYAASVIANNYPRAFPWYATLNPMTVVIEGCRWSLLGKPLTVPWYAFLSIPITWIVLWFALHVFRRTERTFADVV